jgi:hypothetical protein
MTHPSLHKLLELGDRMCAALENGEAGLFSDLVHERGQLLRSIADDFQDDAFTSDEAIQALSEQSARLEKGMVETRIGLGAAVGAISRFRTARSAYDVRIGASGGRLNKSLHG